MRESIARTARKAKEDRRAPDSPGFGWITPLLGLLLFLLTLPSNLILGSRLGARDAREDAARRRYHALKIDTWVASWFAAEWGIYAILMSTKASTALRDVLLILILWRVSDILATAVRIPLFDLRRVRSPHSSTERIIVLGLINYLEVAICFGCVYAFWPGLVSTSVVNGGDKLGWFDPLYLSCVTQLTIGFGDVSPTHGLRIASCLQGFASLGLVALLIGRFLASLPPVPDLDDLNGDKNNKPQDGEQK